MKVYVASKFENQQEVRQAMKMLIDLGHTITHDWTKEDYGNRTGVELAAYRSLCAQEDFDGVKNADALLVINHARGCGMFVEFGMAVALGKAIFVVYPEKANNIFACLPGVYESGDLHDAIDHLDDWGHLKDLFYGNSPVGVL